MLSLHRRSSRTHADEEESDSYPSSSDRSDSKVNPPASHVFFPAQRKQQAVTMLSTGHGGGHGEMPDIGRLTLGNNFSPRKTRAQRLAAQPAPAQAGSSQQPLFPPRFPPLRFGRAWAISLLRAPAPLCPALTIKTRAKKEVDEDDKRALALYHDRAFEPVPMGDLRPAVRQETFKETVFRLQHFFRRGFESFPPVKRILDNESDVGGAFLANFINPIVPTLNAYIAPRYQHEYEIAIFTEVHFKPDSSQNYLDICLMLINKQQPNAREALLSKRHALVIVELKRHHLVDEEDWKQLDRRLDQVKDSNPERLLPQLLRYSHKWNCRRVFLSDYTFTMAYDIETSHIPAEDANIKLGHSPCRIVNPNQARSVYDYGVSMAVAYEAVEALFELGLVNPAPDHLRNHVK
ncbi:hypothetical protein JCM8547_008203 [Rhodosporidiobolus lusitaniae]